ncbi:hypothetical protein H9I45_14990 [Polaribacter haliotis]|uniref:Uncharacterized protein n=1 Tax=Polaribacter haliotis TaxID=1888915 RepID=A0A7L8AFA6_9FLAO|nr:hypothetical protein [Polaribacter haliotis]QOD60624.1 hypothetical protein H9I45_14990 [Polaribacter haliotis]
MEGKKKHVVSWKDNVNPITGWPRPKSHPKALTEPRYSISRIDTNGFNSKHD